uniref:ATP-binding domain-containing protein n=1 Tax=Methanosphaera sp. TaxID=2666342 RepID=UPI0025EB5F35
VYKPSDYMVIGPNKFFVNYISGILPDLDVNGVSEYTIEEVFEKYVGEDYTINNNLDKIIDHDNVSKIKTSLELKNKIDEYFKTIEILPENDFTIKGEVIINKGVIKNFYNDINQNYYKSIRSKVERLILLMTKYIETNKESIISNLIKRNVSSEVINDVKNNIGLHLKKYFKVLNLKIKKIYISILEDMNLNTNEISNNKIDIEDIPPLLYIRYLLIDDNIFENYKHIVIDEAQDYGQFAFYVLNKMFKNATFSIYGDLAQSLYSYRSIDNWECLNDIFNDVEILKLNKSYRTTIEIMDEANKINKKLNLTEAIPVIRHGDAVEYINKNIIELMNELNKKYKTIAIITKTQDEADKLYEKLKDEININLINKANLNYDSNINILPSYLSKGLEFDSVIIVDSFDKENVIDLKLLYVSMTRALHKLVIVGDNNL